MPLLETKGAASAQGFGLTLQQAAPVYIEDVFSTWLYTGNGSTQTITNGIDLSTKGGLVWLKARNQGTTGYPHTLYDTLRGIDYALFSNRTDAQDYRPGDLTSFNSSGFSLGNGYFSNTNNVTYASWTFRKQAKFFDVVTYTGNGVAGRTVAHSLGSVPGCIIVKNVSSSASWEVYHRSIGPNSSLRLNSSNGVVGNTNWNNTAPTSTVFTVGAFSETNSNGDTYVAYLFAHDAGGFGLTGTDNVISCGSYVGNGVTAGPTVTLGYEPQFVIIKNATNVNDWHMFDTMRGMAVSSGSDARLFPNLSNAESLDTALSPTATGFVIESSSGRYNASGDTYIYIAIRRGPMKTPTTGTSVFLPTTYASPGLNVQSTVTTNFPIDLNICGARGANSGYTYKFWFTDRLRVSSGTSTSNSLLTAGNGTASETTYNGLATFFFDRMTSYQITDSNGSFNGRTAGALTFGYNLRRAPGFFDVVCYTGTGSGMTISHNLGATPQIVILKCRDAASSWFFWSNGLTSTNYKMRVNLNEGQSDEGTSWISVSSSSVTLANGYFTTNNNVMYLFATVAGVSKVGSFTGNGSSQTINCGFTGGARFVLIKRTDSSGQWYVWDSARGIVAGNDPYLSFSNDQSEDFNGASDSVDADSTGFIVNQNATNDVNINGASYIFLAIA